MTGGMGAQRASGKAGKRASRAGAVAARRLRLVHVDGAAYTVDEPTLCADPFQFDLPATTWAGELGQREQVAVARPHGRRSAAPTHTRRCQRLAPPPDIRDSPLESPAIAPFTGCGAQ
ncbi:MAG TPA: hypothetical protein PKI03_07185 [Pseudomonadota bacterium]|nr:hypothetical protein [Pseudomonadota bacterium]